MNIEHSSGSNIYYGNINSNDPVLKILFLDTFSPPNIANDSEDTSDKKEPNVGIVRFSSNVVIREIRIIPLSTLVSGESLRNVHLGYGVYALFSLIKTKYLHFFFFYLEQLHPLHLTYIFMCTR